MPISAQDITFTTGTSYRLHDCVARYKYARKMKKARRLKRRPANDFPLPLKPDKKCNCTTDDATEADVVVAESDDLRTQLPPDTYISDSDEPTSAGALLPVHAPPACASS